jgi:hypothetical protein
MNYPNWESVDTANECIVPTCTRPRVGRIRIGRTDLCAQHHEQFPRVLADLAGLWPDLERALYRRSSGTTNSKVQSSKLVDLSSSWNPHVSQTMHDLTDWTNFLVRTVLREVPEPPSETRIWPRTRTVVAPDGTRVAETYNHIQTIDYHHTITEDTPTSVALAVASKHYAYDLSRIPFLGGFLLADAIQHRRLALAAIQSVPVMVVGYAGLVCGEALDEEDGLHNLYCNSPLVVMLDHTGNPGLLVCQRQPRKHVSYEPSEWTNFAHG